MSLLLRLLLVFALLITGLHAQTKTVLKNINGNTITESLIIGSGKTLTIASGATIVAASGSTLTGFGGGLTIDTSAITGGTVGNVLFHKTGDVLGELGTSTGGESTDAGKVVLFNTGGALWSRGSVSVIGASTESYLSTSEVAWSNGTWLARLQAPPTMTSNSTYQLPNVGGSTTILTLANTSSITSVGTLSAGAVPVSLITGTLAASNGGTGLSALGSGVATWLGTPSSANLRGALTDETGTGSAVFATSPTFSGTVAAVDVSTTGRFFGASEPGYPQFTQTGFPGNGMRVFSDRVDFWVGGSVILTMQPGLFNVPTLTWVASGVTLSATSDGTGKLVQKGATTPQVFAVSNTYTSFTNKEEFEIAWIANICRLRPIKGTGGGSSRNAEYHTTETGVNWGSGSGSPEGVRTAPVGSLYTRTDGGANTTLYVKESGTGNTGWIAK